MRNPDKSLGQKPGPKTRSGKRGETDKPAPADVRPEGEPLIRTIAMPADTNPAGDIFGGWLMAQMDLAAGNAAARHAKGRCATVAVDAIKFVSPVKVGDEVTVWATLIRTGRSSMSFRVSAWRRARDSDSISKVTDSVFTFVALDSDGRPRPVPTLPAGTT